MSVVYSKGSNIGPTRRPIETHPFSVMVQTRAGVWSERGKGYKTLFRARLFAGWWDFAVEHRGIRIEDHR